MIVNIIPELALPFDTKKRAPFRIVVEAVKLSEIIKVKATAMEEERKEFEGFEQDNITQLGVTQEDCEEADNPFDVQTFRDSKPVLDKVAEVLQSEMDVDKYEIGDQQLFSKELKTVDKPLEIGQTLKHAESMKFITEPIIDEQLALDEKPTPTKKNLSDMELVDQVLLNFSTRGRNSNNNNNNKYLNEKMSPRSQK